MSASRHDQELSGAFDDQAALFERAPVQSDPAALERLVRFANFPAGASLLDAGCGPGLVAEAFLKAGLRVFGVDLSAEMIDRARKRCGFAADSARFVQGSIHGESPAELAPFDGAYSRYVLHHVEDPRAFLARQVELVRPGGVVVLCDHLTDPDPAHARRHQEMEVARDRTHTRNLTGGEIVDLFASVGLLDVSYVEEEFSLDFDEWFDRGSPNSPKQDVRAVLAEGLAARGFRTATSPGAEGAIRIDCVRALVRGVNP